MYLKIVAVRCNGVLPKASPHHVCPKVDAEDGDGSQGQGDAGQDEEEEGRDLGDVGGHRVGYRLLQVVEDQATWGMMSLKSYSK